VSYTPPVTADELRDERQAAAELGYTVDEYRAHRAEEARKARELDPPPPAPARPVTKPLDPRYIELGRRELARIRQQLNTQQQRKAQP